LALDASAHVVQPVNEPDFGEFGAAVTQRAGPPRFGLDATGLSSERAAALLRESGTNVLPVAKSAPQWRKLLGELTHFFALMLWCAAVLAFVGGLPELGVAIIVVVVVNGIFAHIQQERAQHAAAKLRALLPAEVSVRRDGHILRVHTSELVPGDAVVLTAGDRVPADVVLAVASGCAVDESMLTGESEAVTKASGDSAWGGTFLVNGQADAVVSQTGGNTRLAGIAALTSGTISPPTPLARELRRIVHLIATVALAVAVFFFLVSLLVGIPWRDASSSPSASPLPWSPRGSCLPSLFHWRWGPNGWRRGTPWSAIWRPWKLWVHHFHLYRQDRNPDPKPDERRRSLYSRRPCEGDGGGLPAGCRHRGNRDLRGHQNRARGTGRLPGQGCTPRS